MFPVQFCYILRAYLGKRSVIYVQNMHVHLNAVITLSNNKQNNYSNSIYKIYLKPCHYHCFSLTHFKNTMKTHNDLARRLFTLKRFQYCRFQNTNFSISVFPKFVVNLPITFAVSKSGVDRRITINMEVNLFHSVVSQACNVILQCMHIYKVILSQF